MRKFTIAVVVLLILGALAYAFWPKHQEPPPVADQSTLRQTPLGPVVGFTGKYGANVWLGLPYAAPPVGELRWKAPRPPQPWTTPREALAIGNMCVQFPSLLSGAGRSPDAHAPVGNEDCLYLNIWAPPFSPDNVPSGDKARPVMLWIHGGGNSIGHGGSYSGARLATDHDVLVVTFNYRLGPFGWFSHPALRSADASAEDNSGNYGLLDSIAALHWVRDNIAAFGGDPNNVTIFGESAGGTDVLALMASPLAKGLFHRAIVESGGFFAAPRALAENYHDDAVPGHEFSSREVINRLLVRDGKAGDTAAREDRAERDDRRTSADAAGRHERSRHHDALRRRRLRHDQRAADVRRRRGAAARVRRYETVRRPEPVQRGAGHPRLEPRRTGAVHGARPAFRREHGSGSSRASRTRRATCGTFATAPTRGVSAASTTSRRRCRSRNRIRCSPIASTGTKSRP